MMQAGSGPASSTWVTLALRIDVAGVATAAVDGKVVAAVTPPDYLVVNDPAGTDTGGDGGSNGGGGAVGGPPHPGTGVFAYLAASWSAPMMGWSLANNATATTASSATAAPQATFSNSEFKLVQVNVTASTLPIPTPPGPPPPPPGPPGPSPPPPHGHGLVLAECDGSNPQQAWTFSGEDGAYLMTRTDCINDDGACTGSSSSSTRAHARTHKHMHTHTRFLSLSLSLSLTHTPILHPSLC